MEAYLRLLRPRQWIKNVFVLAPLFFSFAWSLKNILLSFAAAFLFSLAAGGVYALNDALDFEEDRKHPIKRNRPVAAGLVKPWEAVSLAAGLHAAVIVCSLFINRKLAAILGSYTILNDLYSFRLKHLAPLDVFIIAVNFVLRVLAGSAAIGVETSKWMILSVFSLALFLGFAKRRHEFLLYVNGVKTRRNLDGYSLEFAGAAMLLSAALAVVSYVMYAVSPEVQARLHAPHLYLTSLPVVLGVLRYLQITLVENGSGDPTEVVLRDRFLQAVVVLWLGAFLLVVEPPCIW